MNFVSLSALRTRVTLVSSALVLLIVLVWFELDPLSSFDPIDEGAITAAFLLIASFVAWIFFHRSQPIDGIAATSLSRQYYDNAKTLRRRATETQDAASRRDLMLLAVKNDLIGDDYHRFEKESDDE